jgi:hypothetical protein
MQNILDIHQALRRPITSKVNYAQAQILQGKLREDVKKNDLLIAQKSFDQDLWQTSTRVQDTVLYPQGFFDVYAPQKILEFNGELYAFRGHLGGTASPTNPTSLGTVFKYNLATDTWTAIYNIPVRWDADRGTAIDAAVYQGTMWFVIGAQDDTARNDNFMGIYFWNGITFIHQADLNGTPNNAAVSHHVFEVSMVAFNERLFVTSASNQSSALFAYNGQTWTNITNNAPDTISQRTGRLVVFEDDLYWLQTNSTTNTLWISRYLHNSTPTSTTYTWQLNVRSFNTGRANWQTMEVIVHNHTLFILLNLDHHTRVIYTPNLWDFYIMYSTGNFYGRLAEDYKDGINSQWAARWFKSSDNDLYMMLGGTAGRIQFFRIQDRLNNLDFHSRFTIEYLGFGPSVGTSLYDFDMVEYQGYLIIATGQANTVQNFYRIPVSATNNNGNLVWTPAFQYTRSDDYEVNHTDQDYGWMQQRPRGVTFQVYNGELYKAMSSVFYPFIVTWKLVSNKWQKIAEPDVLPAGEVRQVSMEVYDGELYLAVANWASAPFTLTYKWTGASWIKLIDLNPIDTNSQSVKLKTFGNILYLATVNWSAGNRIRTYYFDGTLWISMPDLPSRPNNEMRMVDMEVHNNQLYLAMAAWNSSFDVYLYRLNSDLLNWTSLTGNIPTQPNNNCSAVALKSFNGNLYMAANSDVNSRIYKWDGSSMQLMTSPTNWFNAASDRRSMAFLEYEGRLFLIRGDGGAAPYFRMYSLINEATGQWKAHKRWRPNTLTTGGYAWLQLSAIVHNGEAYISFVNDADNHRPGMQDLKISPPGLIKVHPRQDVRNIYSIGIANEDGLEGSTISIVSFSPDYNLFKNNGWEQMTWQQTGA